MAPPNPSACRQLQYGPSASPSPLLSCQPTTIPATIQRERERSPTTSYHTTPQPHRHTHTNNKHMDTHRIKKKQPDPGIKLKRGIKRTYASAIAREVYIIPLASHTYRRSIQEAHSVRDPYALHTPQVNSIRWNKWCMYALWPPKLLQR